MNVTMRTLLLVTGACGSGEEDGQPAQGTSLLGGHVFLGPAHSRTSDSDPTAMRGSTRVGLLVHK